MCGIIGYVGSRECKPLLLQGLERLEYRGYDSSGFALLESDGLAAALLLCRALSGRTLSEAAAIMPRLPQAKQNVWVTRRVLPQSILDEADRLTEELGEKGRVLVRPSGTEPLVRVLAEAETAEEAGKICASIAALVAKELG